MALPPNVLKMRDLLLRTRAVDEFQMRAALGRVEQWGGRLPRVLAELGMVDEEQVTQLIAATLRMPLQMLGNLTRDGHALAKLDGSFCEERAVFPFAINQRTNSLGVAVADPFDLDLVDLIASKVHMRVQVFVASEAQIKAAVAKAYGKAPPKDGMTAGTQSRAMTSAAAPPQGAMELELDDAPPLPTHVPEPERVERPQSANTLLDEMLGEDERDRGFTEEELVRIGNLRMTQQKTNTIVRALHELLREKGYRV
jgi:hypothetical protein